MKGPCIRNESYLHKPRNSLNNSIFGFASTPTRPKTWVVNRCFAQQCKTYLFYYYYYMHIDINLFDTQKVNQYLRRFL